MRTFLRLIAALSVVLVAACGDDNGGTIAPKDASVDAAAVIDGGIADASPTFDASCFTNPTTHNELINGCTDAQPMAKDPTLPLLADDGGLPPLP